MARNSFYEGDVGTEVAIDTSATEAAASATAAASSATGAASSASAASTSATNAAASYDSFDDRYLGAKSSAPSTDNDSNALVDGALYWNTSSDQMFSWDGSAWSAIKPTSTEQGHINTVSGIQANVTTVAGISSDVTTVAGISSDVAAVENIAANVTAVAGDATDIGAVAAKATEIGRLGTADAVADMALLGTTAAVADMAILATSDIVADMAILGDSDIVDDMAILGASGVVGNIATVAGISSNVTTVAGISSNVTSVAGNASNINSAVSNASNINSAVSNATNINSAVSNATNINSAVSNASNINTVAGSIANVNTTATNISGVNSFADRYRVASSAPNSSLDAGDLYFNTSNNTLYHYTGSAWVAIQSYSVGDGGLTQINFTSADNTKLDGIEAGANITDTANVVAALTAGTGITISGGGTVAAAPVALTTIQTAANQSAQLALTAQEGDVVVRSDENKTYMHNGGSAGSMSDYTLMATPTDAVTSVDGNTGVVTLNHDSLTGFVANEHIDWTQDQGSTNIHAGNYETDSVAMAIALG